MNPNSPLLSICIPTFNRAQLLQSALWSLVDQVNLVGEQVEVVVSDNCSTDSTPVVVEWAQHYMPIRYHRRSLNLGAIKNILGLPDELAKGEFCWILGDDDLVRPDAVGNVLDALQAYPDIDYLFVNHSYESITEREKHGTLTTGADFPELRNLLCRETNNCIVNRWEEIIGFSDVPALFTSLVSHVFRRARWNETTLFLGNGQLFDSLETTFPHTCIIARMMVGKPTYYLGYPAVILFTGTQEWFVRWPEILFRRVLELSDLFLSLGVAEYLVDHYRNTVFTSSANQMRLLLQQPSTSKWLVLKQLVQRYWRYRTMWRMFAQVFNSRLRVPR